MKTLKNTFYVVVISSFFINSALLSQDTSKGFLIMTGLSIGLGGSNYSNSRLNSKCISYHAHFGIPPFCLNYTYNSEISSVPKTEQSDVYINLAVPIGEFGYGLYALLSGGAGISFGTIRKQTGQDNFTQTENFTQPIFTFEPEFGVNFVGKNVIHLIGIKYSYLWNKNRVIQNYSLTYSMLINV